MGTHKTLVSLTVLVVLGLYVFLFELKDKTQDLLEFSHRDVEGLHLTYRDRTIEVIREPSGNWRLTHPLQVSADPSTIDEILSTLRRSKIKRVLEEDPSERDLESFGLSQPWASLAMVTRGGEPLPPILVGETAPLGDQAYVRRGDYPAVFLTGAELKTSLEKTVADFRDKTILQFNQWKVARLEIRKNDERVVLVRDKNGTWHMDAPREGKVNRKAVNDYLSILLQLRAEDFFDQTPPDLKEYRLDDPVLVISFEGDYSHKLETLLVSENEKFFVMREGHPTVYTIDPISYIAIHKTASDFLAG